MAITCQTSRTQILVETGSFFNGLISLEPLQNDERKKDEVKFGSVQVVSTSKFTYSTHNQPFLSHSTWLALDYFNNRIVFDIENIENLVLYICIFDMHSIIFVLLDPTHTWTFDTPSDSTT